MTCDELAQVAEGLEVPFPRAISSQARGALALAERQPLAALELFRAARATWQELDAPYELAQSRVLIGLAYRQLGDEEGSWNSMRLMKPSRSWEPHRPCRASPS